jgi:drug/metabolite transporter (DMT)-like permease
MIRPDSALVGAAPWAFVLIWSTGFVVARYAMPHAPPFSFLCWRYTFSLLVFLLWINASAARWPRDRAQWGHLAVAGTLMHGGYLGGVWAAIKFGLPAGTAALIVGLQPVLTAFWVSWRGREPTLSLGQWLGLVMGLLGLTLVLWRRMGTGEVHALTLGLALLALLSITVGTLYQKRHVTPTDVRTANFIQLAAALLVSLPLALAETDTLDWHPELIGAMAWSVLVMTLGGSSLLYLLIQRGAATQVASLLYLVPPCTAVLAWGLFDEVMTPMMVLGMAMCALGVALVVRS